MSRAHIIRLTDDSADIGGGLPTPAEAPAWRPNEPEGFTQEMDWDASTDVPSGFSHDTDSLVTIQSVVDPTAPVSPSSTRFLDYSGQPCGDNMWRASRSLSGSGYNAFYFAVSHMITEESSGHGANWKIGDLVLDDAARIVFSIRNSNSNDIHKIAIVLQAGADATDAPPNSNNGLRGLQAGDEDDDVEDFVRGEWTLHEFYVRLNTGSNYDGIARCWKNGVLLWEFTQVRYSTTTHAFTQDFQLYHNNGGVGGVSAEGMGYFYDHAYAAGGTV